MGFLARKGKREVPGNKVSKERKGKWDRTEKPEDWDSQGEKGTRGKRESVDLMEQRDLRALRVRLVVQGKWDDRGRLVSLDVKETRVLQDPPGPRDLQEPLETRETLVKRLRSDPQKE